MREILFRGKRESNGEWIEGYLYPSTGRDKGKWLITVVSLDLNTSNTYSIIPDTVGEFTGLFDRYGNGIFEGDIVKKDYHCTNGKVFQVKYDAGCACFVTSCEHNGAIIDTIFNNDGQHTEILGNIYDNPELLENNTRKDKSI